MARRPTDPDGATRVLDLPRVERELDAHRAEEARCARERRRILAASTLAFGAVLGRSIAALARPSVLAVGQPIAEIAAGLLLVGGIVGVLRALRLDRYRRGLQHDVATLELAREMLLADAAPNVVLLAPPAPAKRRRGADPALASDRSPYRSPAPIEPQEPSPRLPEPRRGWILRPAALAACLLLTVGAWLALTRTSERSWTFLERADDPTSLGFRIPLARAGAWQLADDPHATGGRALVNLAGAPDVRPATAVLDDPAPRDVRLSTRCKISPDRPAGACGLVFRHRGEDTYYVARADAGAQTVALAAIVGGREEALYRASAVVVPGAWQALSVEARRDHLVVRWNERRVIDIRDPLLDDAGAVGLWAPSESIAAFDELRIRPLVVGLDPEALLPLLPRPHDRGTSGS